MKNTIVLKNKSIIALLLLVCFGFFSCEDVIDVDLDKGEAKLVIDAEIVWQKGTDGSYQIIKISRMAAYYDPETPKVSGALVYVENSKRDQFAFSETSPGVYICTTFIPQLNETYTMHVEADGQIYTATETMVPVSEINRIEYTKTGGFQGTDPEVAIFFNDPVNEVNYYLTKFISPTLPYPDFEVNDDELTNGNEIKADFSDEDLKSGDTLEIDLKGISHQFYNYMNLILEASDSNPFATPPANIKGNILKQSSGGSAALGYFRLCESDHRTYVLE